MVGLTGVRTDGVPAAAVVKSVVVLVLAPAPPPKVVLLLLDTAPGDGVDVVPCPPPAVVSPFGSAPVIASVGISPVMLTKA